MLHSEERCRANCFPTATLTNRRWTHGRLDGFVGFKATAGEPWTCPRCLDGQLLWYDTDATKDLELLYHKLACNRCGHVELITATPRAEDEEVKN
jgi:hypothetical protein